MHACSFVPMCLCACLCVLTLHQPDMDVKNSLQRLIVKKFARLEELVYVQRKAYAGLQSIVNFEDLAPLMKEYVADCSLCFLSFFLSHIGCATDVFFLTHAYNLSLSHNLCPCLVLFILSVLIVVLPSGLAHLEISSKNFIVCYKKIRCYGSVKNVLHTHHC